MPVLRWLVFPSDRLDLNCQLKAWVLTVSLGHNVLTLLVSFVVDTQGQSFHLLFFTCFWVVFSCTLMRVTWGGRAQWARSCTQYLHQSRCFFDCFWREGGASAVRRASILHLIHGLSPSFTIVWWWTLGEVQGCKQPLQGSRETMGSRGGYASLRTSPADKDQSTF